MQFCGAPFTIERKLDDDRDEGEGCTDTHQVRVPRIPENWMRPNEHG